MQIEHGVDHGQEQGPAQEGIDYTDPSGERFLRLRDGSSAFYFFKRVGKGGLLPENLRGRFTGDRFVREAIARHEAQPKMVLKSDYREMRKEKPGAKQPVAG